VGKSNLFALFLLFIVTRLTPQPSFPDCLRHAASTDPGAAGVRWSDLPEGILLRVFEKLFMEPDGHQLVRDAMMHPLTLPLLLLTPNCILQNRQIKRSCGVDCWGHFTNM